jgi:hypothetical protein
MTRPGISNCLNDSGKVRVDIKRHRFNTNHQSAQSFVVKMNINIKIRALPGWPADGRCLRKIIEISRRAVVMVGQGVPEPTTPINPMNETIRPPSGSEPQPKNSGLAISSLVLGIIGLVLLLVCIGPLFAIPAVICGHMAYSRIKRSGGALVGQGIALAGLITGYLSIALSIFLIPMMLAIAIPNFVKARDVAMQNACSNNLRMIDGAKQRWALENDKKAGDVPTAADLKPYFKSGVFPVCPAGGTYTIGAVSNAPTCSVPGHQLPGD